MSNKESNFPTAQFTRSVQKESGFISSTVHSIAELASYGKPESEEELKQRIQQFFDFCADNDFRPGVEALALSLGVNRTTFWHWCNQDYGVSEEWADICRIARQSIVAFVEAAANSGHLSPPIAIFSLKNLANWKDTVSFEDITPESDSKRGKMNYYGISAYRLPVLEEPEQTEVVDSEMM